MYGNAMIFNMDLSNDTHTKTGEDTINIPSAPPPSPNLNSRRKNLMNLRLPMSKLIECCEDLVIKQSSNFTNYRSQPLHMKRKTSDSDECCSSSSSSAGTSPRASDCSSSFGKRSRSSMNLESFSFKRADFSLMELSAAISASET